MHKPLHYSVPLIVCFLAAMQPQFAAASGAGEDPCRIENGFVRLSGAGGRFESFEVDPSGQGKYGRNWILALRVGEWTLPGDEQTTWESTDTSIRFRGVPVAKMDSREIGKQGPAFPLWPGKRLGQRFRVAFPSFIKVGGMFPTWCDTHSGFTLTLRREGPEGDVVARKVLRDVADGAEQTLEFKPQPPGVYYLEISEPVGSPGWWYGQGRESEEQTAIVTGAVADEPADMTFWMRIYGYSMERANWKVELDGAAVRWKVDAPKRKGEKKDEANPPEVQLITPWIKDGYDTTDPRRIVFTRFVSDQGIYRPVHQFKRRSTEGLRFAKWFEMTSTAGFNLRFVFPSGTTFGWRMDADSMTYPFPQPDMSLEIRPYFNGPPDGFPVFFSSNPELDETLNSFFYSHGLNFGAGTFPDWKEWQTRILCWTKNPEKDLQASYLKSGYKIREDGYVYTWGDTIGWPFPFKDKDGDGLNDIDTRHFTTNPGFILGCANHLLWSRDVEFLKAILPRVRLAMKFQLKAMAGEKGVMIITAKGHEGRNMGNGSNYWDILPFGHKDAFTNAYYYASIEAMARIEEMAAAAGLPPGDNPPAYFRELRKTVRADYQESFWDDKAGRFVGCVDVDGVKHDYGFTWINLDAMAYGLADPEQVKRIYDWMENHPTATGKADTYSRWVFAPRASTFFNPPFHLYNWKDKLTPTDLPPWWHGEWHMGDYETQCQAGGAILYTSYSDILARAKYLGADNAFRRFAAILDRYAEPDHLSGGSPLYRGESSQGHGIAGSVGTESEFPESGLVPSSFLYAFLGIEPDVEGLAIRPNLPKGMVFAGVRNLSYAGKTLEVRVEANTVAVRCIDPGATFAVEKTLTPGEAFVVRESDLK